MPSRSHPDVLIAGAGLVGLTLALELAARGARVTVFDPGPAHRQASFAAAGMLAVHDPHNPAALLPLSELSAGLYPAFLHRLATLSGRFVPFQTDTTLQHLPDGRVRSLAERSLDPRQLAEAVACAVQRTSIELLENAAHPEIEESSEHAVVRFGGGIRFQAPRLVLTAGAWMPEHSILPRKGQMLRVALPASLRLCEVHRDAEIYIVPRTSGPQAGSALIGATVEEAGFDLTTHRDDLARLRRTAAHIIPALGDPAVAPQREAWAGLRPTTPDLLPMIGQLPGSSRRWIAGGHFRNGILLAPGTAAVMADLLEGKLTAVSLLPFSPGRFRAGFSTEPL